MSKRREPTVPMARQQTVRQQLLELLSVDLHSVRQLAQAARLREREVAPHLEHLERSLRHGELHLERTPAECLACGFRFEQRRAFTTPGACPRCRSERIEPPLFRVVGPPLARPER